MLDTARVRVETLTRGEMQRASLFTVGSIVGLCIAVEFLAIVVMIVVNPTTVMFPVPVVLAVAAVTVVFVAVFIVDRASASWFVSTLVVSSFVALACAVPFVSATVYPWAPQWILLAVFASALLLEPSWARVVVLVVVAAATLMMGIRYPGVGEPGYGQTVVLLTALAGISIGLGLVAANSVLTQMMDRQQEVFAVGLNTQEASQRSRARFDELVAVTNTIHDTLLNTFTAIAAGAGKVHPELVVSHAAAEVVALNEFERVTTNTDVETVRLLSNAVYMAGGSRAMMVNVNGSSTSDAVLVPSRVLDGFIAAIEEILANIKKVCDGPVSVTLHHDSQRLVMVWTTPGVSWWRQYRLTGKVRALLRPVNADIESVRQRHLTATTMTLQWSPVVSSVGMSSTTRSILVPMGRVCAAWLAAGFIIEMVVLHVELGVSTGYVWSVLAVVTLLGLTAISQNVVRLSRAVFVALIASVLLLSWGPPLAMKGFCVVTHTVFFGENWALLVTIAMIVLVPQQYMRFTVSGVYVGACAVTAAVWLFAGEQGCGAAGVVRLAIDTVVILATNIFVVRLAAVGRVVDGKQAQLAAAWELFTVLAERTRVRRVYATRVLPGPRALLADIADGVVQPDDEQVMLAAARQATFLRAVNSAPAQLGALGDTIRNVVVFAADHDVSAVVHVGPVVARHWDVEQLAQLESKVCAAMAALDRGSAVRLSVEAHPRLMMDVAVLSGEVPVQWAAEDASMCSGELVTVVKPGELFDGYVGQQGQIRFVGRA